MSMNLCFSTKVGGHHVDFPYQTRTELTFAVLNASNLEDRLALVREDLESRDWYWREVNDMVDRVEDMMTDPALALEMI